MKQNLNKYLQIIDYYTCNLHIIDHQNIWELLIKFEIMILQNLVCIRHKNTTSKNLAINMKVSPHMININITVK